MATRVEEGGRRRLARFADNCIAVRSVAFVCVLLQWDTSKRLIVAHIPETLHQFDYR